MTLSKSQYTRALQCHKSLWLYKNTPSTQDTPDTKTQSNYDTGYMVGELARQLYPDGVAIEFLTESDGSATASLHKDSSNFAGMITKTTELIKSGKEIIYEATFKIDGLFVMVDMLVKNGDVWDIYEVKSATTVKSQYIDDVAFQWFVLSKVLPLGGAFVVHIDSDYTRDGRLDVRELFNIANITALVAFKLPQIPQTIGDIASMLSGDMPHIDIGGHCSSPYRCDFYTTCHRHIPSPSVFDLYRMRSKDKFDLYSRGILSYSDIPDDTRLSEIQKLQISTTMTKKPHIDISKIRQFIGDIEFPINFFDFETFQEAVPRFDDQRPYMQMPFQYSLHILQEDGSCEHKEFLCGEYSDPRSELIDNMLLDISSSGTIVAYNQGFEKRIIRELAKHDKARATQLLSLNDRFVDLIKPFRSRGYYHPAFNGSFSIKSVLPAMFPDDDELDYKKLGSIQNGGDAMDIFAKLHLLKDKNKRKAIRLDLIAYCKLDTWAMVKIYQKLLQIIGRPMRLL
ncbi:MAG: DUF2779 domain-containing protein [Epsilonproteobacteria bacterium]|nr:MAG: DUF2779 domain-containing protein [Campylobacterota bacterium]